MPQLPAEEAETMIGPELCAETTPKNLVAALNDVIPEGWVSGADQTTPNRIRVFERHRRKCASVEIELPRTLTVFDLRNGATRLSRQIDGYAELWDPWPRTNWFQFKAGQEISSFDPEHNGEYQGLAWDAIERGETAPPFESDLVALLKEHQEELFVAGLMDHNHGARAARGNQLGSWYYPYVALGESAASRQLVERLLSEAKSSGKIEVQGLGRIRWSGTSEDGEYIVAPALDLKLFGNGDGPLSIDLQAWTSTVDEATAATVQTELSRALHAARDGRKDVLFAGRLLFSRQHVEGYSGRNPRDGTPIEIAPKELLHVLVAQP